MFPNMVQRNFVPFTKHAPLLPIHALPNRGLFGGAVLWISIFAYVIITPLTPQGLLVSLRNGDVATWDKSPWSESLVVYVRPPRRFFINGEEVGRDSLRTKLLERLSHSGAWTVYFEADSDTLYIDAIYAIDTIQGCGAKVIWITPKMQEAWKHKVQFPR